MSHQARYYATSIKQSVASLYATNPQTFAHEAISRALFEIGDVMADVHGTQKAATSLYAVADAIAVRAGIEAVWPPKTAVPLSKPDATIDAETQSIVDAMSAAIQNRIEGMGDVVRVSFGPPEVAAAPTPRPASGIRALTEGFASWCSDNWIGVAFIAFYLGLALGAA